MPWPVGRSPIAPAQLVVDARGDELAEHAVRAEDAERAVLRVGQVHGELDDPAQRVGQAEVARHGHDGVEQAPQAVLDVEHVLGAGDQLAQQRVETQAAERPPGPPARPCGPSSPAAGRSRRGS